MALRGTPNYLKLGPLNPEAQKGSTPNANITKQELQSCDGWDPDKPIYIAIKGQYFNDI